MSKNLQARQGDLLFERITPAAFAKQKGGTNKPYESHVFAHGEVTGHMHAMKPTDLSNVDMYVDTEGHIFISSTKEIEITHDEHGTVTLPPGEYCMTRQREYDWATEQTRKVAD